MSGNSITDLSSYWNRWASVWDIMLRLVGLDCRYREQGISVLNLRKGMTVLDIACGTGLNFPYLFQAVGPEGRIIAVDIAPKMLQKAKERANKNGLNNVEFIQGDVSLIELPYADAAPAFWCMISIPEHQMALENIISSLLSGGRLAVLDLKFINDFPGAILNPIFNQICRFTHQDVNREPWLYMEQLIDNVKMREWKLGGLLLSNVYLAWGEKK
ncbi:MAG: class I SAM-dependent methyltransferase [Candidatus Methanoperedens sp.]|nr:class I SAM-dependent methyltransferase [Candidatus Methanoperedens sp.]CAG1009727.1 demethylmenaquinone methyltransferase / 2-methoxy-6-polyprenyl-1,4-benzoquinol methylase [Methanosarcinales archaeon]